MKKPQELTVGFIDYGTFVYFAEAIAPAFKKFYYTCPREGPFPLTARDDIGSGIPGITNIPWPEFWSKIKEIDLFIFPFINDGWMAEHLRSLGKLVVSTGRGEYLERDRPGFKKMLADLGLPVIPYRHELLGKTVHTWDALRKEMQENENFWIKFSDYRGVGETHHCKSYAESEEWLFEKGHLLGMRRHNFPAHLEDDVPGQEVGDDIFFNGKKILDYCLYGIEDKDQGYICKVIPYTKMPHIIKVVHDKVVPMLREFGVQSPLSTELRVPNRSKALWNDACMRIGSPPGEIICKIWTNLPDVLVAIAYGEDITPTFEKTHGASIFLYSHRVKKEQTPVTYPIGLKNNVMLQNYCRKDGQNICIPQDEGAVLGAVVGFGNSKEEAAAEALSVAERVKAEGLYYSESVFDRLDEALIEAKKLGVGIP